MPLASALHTHKKRKDLRHNNIAVSTRHLRCQRKGFVFATIEKGEQMRVYKYGLQPPTKNADLVRQELRNAWEYRNKLVELLRQKRTELRAAEAAYGDIPKLVQDVTELTEAVAAAEKKGREWKAQARSNKLPSDIKELVKALRARRGEAKQRLAERRKAMLADPTVRAEYDRISEDALALGREARHARKCEWGTGGLIEQANQAASKKPMWNGTKPQDPHFVTWKGKGRIGVQFVKGASISKVFSSNTQLRIAPVNESAWESVTRSERRRESRTVLSMRVGSDDQRNPVWAQWPMIMHRPLPAGAIIKSAAVHVRKIGPRERWHVTITVDDSATLRPQYSTHGVIAVDVGWRQIGDELRVCAWHDGDESGELRLSSELVSALHRPEQLRSDRDKNLTTALKALKTALAHVSMPDWMRALTVARTAALPTQPQALAYLTSWRSQARLSSLAIKWRENRFVGDAEMFDALEAWRRQDKHLWSWEASQWTKAILRRRELYRVFAAELAKRYTTLILEDFLLPPIVEEPDIVSGKTKIAKAASNRVLVATYVLRGVLTNAFNSHGGQSIKVPAQYTTMTCHECGVVEEFDAIGNIRHTCINDHEWDQDQNAAVNIWGLGIKRLHADALAETARNEQDALGNEAEKKETKRARVARLRAEKLARMASRAEPSISTRNAG